MKISVIATLGTSPPVVTEFVQWVDRVLNQKVSDLSIVVTRELPVLEGLELVKTAILRRYPRTHIHIYELSFTDILSKKESLEFFRYVSRLLRDQRKFAPDRVYLCIAGGRKDMCINLSLLAQYFNVNGVFHVITHDVKVVNQLLERLRHHITELTKSEDKNSYYSKYAERFDEVMYPPLDSYTVVKLPVLPYPTEILQEIAKLSKLTGAIGRRELERRLPYSVVEGLSKLGWIRISGKGMVRVTEDGHEILSLLE